MMVADYFLQRLQLQFSPQLQLMQVQAGLSHFWTEVELCWICTDADFMTFVLLNNL